MAPTRSSTTASAPSASPARALVVTDPTYSLLPVAARLHGVDAHPVAIGDDGALGQRVRQPRRAAAVPCQPQHAHRHVDRARCAGGGAGRGRRGGGHRRGVLRLRAALVRRRCSPTTPTGWCCAPSPSRTRWPACAWATRWARPSWSPTSSPSASPTRSTAARWPARWRRSRTPATTGAWSARWSSERARLSEELAERGWALTPSQANFVCGVPPGAARPRSPRTLRDRRVLVRFLTSGGAGRVRITVGTPAENDALLAALG